MATGGVSIVAAGLNVAAAGATVTGGLTSTGNLIQSGGSVSLTSSTTTGNTLDAYASVASFTNNVIVGRVAAGVTTGNVLALYEGTNLLMQVRTAASDRNVVTPSAFP